MADPAQCDSLLRAELFREEARLTQLDDERTAILANIQNIRSQLAAFKHPVSQNPPASPLSPEVKIALFRTLFKGREDLYPKMWLSKNGDRKGYMPACGNDGDYSLCGKRHTPRIKCADCRHQAYLPVTDKVNREHLQGKQTIGVYPLLPDDTCWFPVKQLSVRGWLLPGTVQPWCWFIANRFLINGWRSFPPFSV